jgi:hypothetical protein
MKREASVASMASVASTACRVSCVHPVESLGSTELAEVWVERRERRDDARGGPPDPRHLMNR